MSSIAFRDVVKRFPAGAGELTAIDGISLVVPADSFAVLVGPSGCGKSTLLHMVAGLEMPSSGAVLVGDQPVRRPAPDRAVVFQKFALFPWKTVRENIAFGLRNLGVPGEERDKVVRHYLELMGLDGFGDRFPHQLSGGMQQRVAIARAYAVRPRVLLMDEPFAALDAQLRVVLQENLVQLWTREGGTVLFITHSVDEAVYLADDLIVMTRRPGRVKRVLDLREVSRRLGWRKRPIEEVMEDPEYLHFKTEVWRNIKEELT
ncbi:MAG TPA: ABC transporter ATP-binding protein [Methylomirabilota bacterium]|jgi:NitT/TauT family transport system ATP-binding protein|nr:ABC transporter ATP-binding protein [Methylomirabilota bacterium]